MRWVILVGGVCSLLGAVMELVEPWVLGGEWDGRRVRNAALFGALAVWFLVAFRAKGPPRA
jgi:hypothetical protein